MREEALRGLLDALDDRRERLRLGRGRGLAAVLPDRLALVRPVVPREGLRVAVLVDVRVGRDDVSPIGSGVDGSLVVEMPAVQVAVVGDRGLVRDVRVLLRARRVTDPDFWLRPADAACAADDPSSINAESNAATARAATVMMKRILFLRSTDGLTTASSSPSRAPARSVVTGDLEKEQSLPPPPPV